MSIDSAIERPPHLRGPGVCGNDLETVSWSASSVFALSDGRQFGIRSTSPEVHAAIDELLDKHRVDAEPVPALFSVRIATAGKRRGAPLHHLYHGGQIATGTRDVARLVRSLLLRVDELLSAEPAGLRVNATAVRTPGGSTVLVPSELQLMTKQVDRVLVPAGFALADTARVVLDPARATVTVPSTQLVPDADGLDVDRLRGLAPSNSESWLPCGTTPLSAWWLVAPGTDPGPLRGARALAAVTALVAPPYDGGAAGVLAATTLAASNVPLTSVQYATQDDLVESVASTLTS